MNDFWATRSGRWRVRLQQDPTGSIEQRLCRVIVMDIGEGLLPSGAILPSARRVAGELRVDEATVARAYRLLQLDGFLEHHPGKGLVIASAPDDALHEIGAATQTVFDENLLAAARRAMAEGVSTQEASGIFRRPVFPSDPDHS